MTHYAKITIDTQREGMVNITSRITEAIMESGVTEGLCVIHCPHTTAGLTINENADPDVTKDMLYALNEISPDRARFRHMEGNSAAHVKASLMGAGITLIVHRGRPVLGIWQGIYFCEFDGPRARTVHVQVAGE
ncbi:MAG: secondary thiamine-phosphate synthase enzyme YjbQ [Oscillospiraceae bacterium]|nr:secondary thiamine-phosphate synthase enzyme YjbQ [Oscillospiraceae bacterium]